MKESKIYKMLKQKLNRILLMLIAFIIIFGIFLRLFQYSLNRSLWLDEAFIALNIVNKSFFELTLPLDYAQVCPIGFLFVTKALVLSFGDNEYVLRLFPLIAGIASIILFYQLAKKNLETYGSLVAIGLFSISGPLIYYASEVKQYSTDVTFALIIMALAISIKTKGLNKLSAFLFGFIGAISIWFSLPAVFILAGTGSTLGLSYLFKKQRQNLKKVIFVYCSWLLSFALFMYIYTQDISANKSAQQFFWNYAFMPFPPTSLLDLRWYPQSFLNIFRDPMGYTLYGLSAFVFLLGCLSTYSKDKGLFFIYLSPIFYALLASTIKVYPFTGRLLFFLTPSIILFIGAGIDYLGKNSNQNSKLITFVVAGLLFYTPVTLAVHNLLECKTYQIRPNEDTRSVIEYVNNNKDDGDLIYVYYWTTLPFSYYAERYGFENGDFIEGVDANDDWSKYLNDINMLKGHKRVWLIFSHTQKWGDETFFINRLDCIGVQLDKFTSTNASVYLYDMTLNPFPS